MRFRRFVVEGDSMAPTLRPGDFVIGRSTARLAPQDIAAFQHPERPGFWLIKRVIATSGTVDLDRGTVDDQPYRDRFREPLVEAGRFEVPPGTVFVLSDNRRSTRVDSRLFGAVSAANSFRIEARYWPGLRRF